MTREGYPKAAEQVLYLAACAVNGTVPDAGRIREVAFVQAKSKAIRKVALMDAEKERLSRRLEEAGIGYMSLKGCVLEDLGFRAVCFGCGCHDVCRKVPVCCFALPSAAFHWN